MYLEERWILANLKRWLTNKIEGETGYESTRKTFSDVLIEIAKIEADAVIGTKELAEEFADKAIEEEEA